MVEIRKIIKVNMKQYEYKRVTVDTSYYRDITGQLNEFGKNGWLLVHLDPNNEVCRERSAYFVREKKVSITKKLVKKLLTFSNSVL